MANVEKEWSMEIFDFAAVVMAFSKQNKGHLGCRHFIYLAKKG